MHPKRRASWAVLLLTAAALPLAGCGGDEPDTTTSAPSSGASASASTPPATSAPPSAPPSTPSSVSPAALKAADGTRLAACADARCEVVVKAGDVIRFNGTGERRAGFGDIEVKHVAADEVTFTLASGSVTFTQPGRELPDTGNLNDISLTLVSLQGGRAVIRLGKFVPGEFSARVGPGGMTVTTPGN